MGGWVAFLVVVIASSGRLLCNDVVSGLRFQGLPSHFFSFSIYFEIDKYYPVWTGPDQARPVQDCQSGARSSSTFRLDRTGLSPTPDRVRPDWWNHWRVAGQSRPQTVISPDREKFRLGTSTGQFLGGIIIPFSSRGAHYSELHQG